jgi:hypothetical protein
MLISKQRTGGFRQIVTKDGEPIFTRLTAPMPSDTGASYAAGFITLDLQASLDYLARMGLSDIGQMRLVGILPEAMNAAIAALKLPLQTIMTITPHQAARRLKLPFAPAPDESDADIIHAAWLTNKRRPRVALSLPKSKPQQKVAPKKLITAGVAAAAILTATLSALWGYDYPPRASMAATPEIPAAINHTETKNEPETIQPQPIAEFTPQTAPPMDKIKLDAVIYYSPDDWTVWMQGKRWTPSSNDPRLHIISTAPDKVRLSITNAVGGATKEITLRPHQVYDPATGKIGEDNEQSVTAPPASPDTPPAFAR